MFGHEKTYKLFSWKKNLNFVFNNRIFLRKVDLDYKEMKLLTLSDYSFCVVWL